jgi:preprotein translocase subunit SecE
MVDYLIYGVFIKMLDQETTKSNSESLRELVEKNLAKEKTDNKQSKPKQLNEARDSHKLDSGKSKASKFFRFFPMFKFFRSSFGEIRLVTWPNRRDTLRLTYAVIIFSVIFGIMISLLDWGFEIIFKKVFLHG